MFSHSNTASFFCVLIAAFIFSLSAVGGAWAAQAAGEHRSRERGGGGKIKIVYDEAGGKTENLDGFCIVKEAGGVGTAAYGVDEWRGPPDADWGMVAET